MASIVKSAERDEARAIALARAESSKAGRMDSLRPLLKSLEVGDALTMDDADLALWDEALPRIVGKVTSGYSIPKAEHKLLRAMFAGTQRAFRDEVTGDATSKSCALLGGFVTIDGKTHYEVTRTA